jgi:lipoprotein-releasing system ATP-binding protein
MTRDLIIRCQNIHKKFLLDKHSGSELHVLKGIDFEIHAGEMIAIVGASGSGKSTLLHILGGLDEPSQGKVYWQEKDLYALSDEAVARLRGTLIGFVFQFHHLLPEFTAIENVMIPALIQKIPSARAEARAGELLAKVGLSERFNHKPGELSGGEQQRVAVARALANNPKVIFADEPTGNLDSASSTQLVDLLLELNRTEGQAFVLVTHNEAFAGRSGRVYRMLDGQLHALTL